MEVGDGNPQQYRYGDGWMDGYGDFCGPWFIFKIFFCWLLDLDLHCLEDEL